MVTSTVNFCISLTYTLAGVTSAYRKEKNQGNCEEPYPEWSWCKKDVRSWKNKGKSMSEKWSYRFITIWQNLDVRHAFIYQNDRIHNLVDR